MRPVGPVMPRKANSGSGQKFLSGALCFPSFLGEADSWEKIQLHEGRAAAALKFRSPAGLVISLKTKQTENTLTIFQCLVQQRKCLLVGVLFLPPLSRTCSSSPNGDPAHMGYWLPSPSPSPWHLQSPSCPSGWDSSRNLTEAEPDRICPLASGLFH